jgi:hypothetical protein
MVGDEFAFRVDRLAQLIGKAHEPSVGGYKEALLRATVAEFIPKRYSVGHGFVVFTGKSSSNDYTSDDVDLWNLKEHYVSQQLDLIVYDEYNFPPILRYDSFVVLRPESVRAIVEVKGYATAEVVKDVVNSCIDFAKKWSEYKRYRESWEGEPLHIPGLQAMAWAPYVSPSGKVDCDGSCVRRIVVNTYRECLSPELLNAPDFLLLNAFYLYNDFVVLRCCYSNESTTGRGYATRRGRLVRYDDSNNPVCAGDGTIASLLAQIHLSLETPFNPDFSYVDQSMSDNKFRHPCTGITDLDSGRDADA